MDGISTKVLITGLRCMPLELTVSLVPKQPSLGSHRLVVVAVGPFQGHIGRILPCRYEVSLSAGDTTVSDQYMKTERGWPLLFFCQAVG